MQLVGLNKWTSSSPSKAATRSRTREAVEAVTKAVEAVKAIKTVGSTAATGSGCLKEVFGFEARLFLKMSN